jgi:hypothetical protein
MSDRPKIKISLEDTESSRVSQVVEQLQTAKEVPLVREIGDAKSTNSDGIITVISLLFAGLLGGFFTWVAWRSLPESQDTFTSNMQASFTLTLLVATVLILADGAMSRSGAKLAKSSSIAIPTAIVLALLLGLVANSIYSSLVEATWDDLLRLGLSNEQLYEAFLARNHLNRGLAWSILGLAAGLSVGMASLALKRVLITGAGGLVGGFTGGFVFDFISGDESLAQITGLAITGAAVGLSVSLLEQVTKSSWLEIVRGGMAGKQFILYQSQITIGSSPSANITLIKDPAIAPIAATIKRVGTSVKIVAADRSNPISVDGASSFERQLSDGSSIILGSTELRFREKSQKINDSGILRG